ncbi:MAG: hypothetical protein H3C34_19065 [Caldilineaceae bacterium]|nr:hypothetical protein [Caldilineaceae bacterium]
MLRSVYEWLWPLFEACSGPDAIPLSYTSPLHITDQYGNTLYDSGGYPLQLVACICPTATMDLLLILAGLGVLLTVIFVTMLGAWALRGPKSTPSDQIVERVVAELDRVSNEFLKRTQGEEP